MGSRDEEYITYGGISIINAVPAWLGGSLAIDLKVKTRISEGSCEMNDFINFILNYLGSRLGFIHGVCVEVNSEVPPGSGLKSNSAVAVGVVYSLLRFLGKDVNPVDAAKLAAEVTRAHGSSITGAFDDASAAILGGAVLTDNKSLRIIKQLNPDSLTVVITGYMERKRLQAIDRLRALSGIYQALFNMALSGDLWRAATINGMLIAESLEYHNALKAIGVALRLGAVASGVSGNGPSIYAIFKAGEEGPFIDYIRSTWGYHLITSLVGIRYLVL
ncbi:shikimate kinase [Vulcanisaeta moutnovskia 768-28]|uniref:Shikimate kinase n=1 Tax=Vulcanisaeta moutnovskia (strain 768-28) TaxID=985053 RepID=F0QT43_VULM7|nr:shikimate kinase [Vulcanisaeta moutnovskia]ADY01632.1 shikimate kinase [Vulcanisaeta moutnovskia 768-28]